MADRIKGITIEIGGDTTGLSKALSGVNKEIKETQSQLEDVERLLKLDPTNTELLKQKQKILAEAVEETKNKLDKLKEANEQVSKTADNYDEWKKAYDPIKDKIDETNKKLKELKKQSEEADEQLANNEISQEKYDAIQEEIKETSKELQELKKEAKAVSEEFGNPVSPEQYDSLQREIIETEQNLKKLEEQAKLSNAAAQEISALGGKVSKAGQGIETVGEKILPLSAAVTALGTASAIASGSFEEAMSKVKAISGATEEEMEKLNQKAIEMGASTKFSAKESADAFTYMAMAGWDAQQMIDGIGGIMSLAAADGLDLATTSDIVTDALTAFGLNASDSAHFADVLAQASSSANTNVSMLGESFKYVAPIAGTLGYTAEDTAIALGIMANAGIKGGQAGTTLKNALANMASPSKNMVTVMDEFGLSLTNTDGSMKTLSEVLAMLRENMAVTTKEQAEANYALYEQEALTNAAAVGNNNLAKELNNMTESQRIQTLEYMKGCDILESLSEEQLKKLAKDELDIKLTKERVLTMEEYDYLARTLGQDTLNGVTEAEQAAAASMLFGKEAMAGMLNVINASEEDYNKLSDAIYGCDGRADSMAETMMDNTPGAIEQAKGALETLAIMVGDKLSPAIRAVAEFIASIAEKASGMSSTTMTLIVVIGTIVAALGPLLIMAGKILQSVGSIMSFAPQISAALGAVKTAVMGLSGPIGIVIAVVAALVAGFGVLYTTNEEFRNKVNVIWAETCASIKGIIDQILAIFEAFKAIGTEMWQMYGDEIFAIVNAAFDAIAAVIETVMTLIKDIVAIALALISGDWNAVIDGIVVLIQNFAQNAKNIFSTFLNALESIVILALTVISDLWSAFKSKIIEIVLAIVGDVKNRFKVMKEDALMIFEALKSGIAEKVKTVRDTIIEGISVAVEWIKELPSKAIGWGKDFIDGFVDGIREKIDEVSNVVESVADTVTEFLHFSRPDRGPLRYYEEWMPDMMQGLADGIRDNMWRVTDQLSILTGSMSGNLHSVADMGPSPMVIRSYNQTILDGKVIAESVNENLGVVL